VVRFWAAGSATRRPARSKRSWRTQVDAGIVFVSVTIESPRGRDLLGLLAKEGGTSVVATPTTLTASV